MHPILPDENDANAGPAARLTFSCSEYQYSGNNVASPPYDVYDTNPIAHESGIFVSSHARLVQRMDPTITFDTQTEEEAFIDFTAQNHLGFFLKKEREGHFSIDFASRTLQQVKFSYDGLADMLTHVAPTCGDRTKRLSPRCWPTQDWSCAISDATAMALRVENTIHAAMCQE